MKYTVNNTVLTTWFERDRANVRLDTLEDRLVLNLWDSEVYEFQEDGFWSSSKGWHQSLVDYANYVKVTPGVSQ